MPVRGKMGNASGSIPVRATGVDPLKYWGTFPQFQFLNYLKSPLDLHGLVSLIADTRIGTMSITILVDLISSIYQDEPQETSSKVPIIKDKSIMVLQRFSCSETKAGVQIYQHLIGTNYMQKYK